jgi:hypothetical protein
MLFNHFSRTGILERYFQPWRLPDKAWAKQCKTHDAHHRQIHGKEVIVQ